MISSKLYDYQNTCWTVLSGTGADPPPTSSIGPFWPPSSTPVTGTTAYGVAATAAPLAADRRHAETIGSGRQSGSRWNRYPFHENVWVPAGIAPRLRLATVLPAGSLIATATLLAAVGQIERARGAAVLSKNQ